MKISGLRMEQPAIISTFGLHSTRQLTHGEYIHQSDAYFDKERTGYDKNHNCGFVRDSYGYLKEGDMTVMYTGATGLIDGIAPFCRLWTYRICQYEILCHEF